MSTGKKGLPLRKYFVYFSLLLALVELITTVSTPYTRSGLTVKNRSDGFHVTAVVHNSVGYEAGIAPGDVYVAINDFTLEFYNSLKTTDAIARHLGTVYQLDIPMVFRAADGTEKTFVIPSDMTLLQRLHCLCPEDIVVFSVGFIFIILSLVCHHFLEYEQDAGAFVTILCAAGLTIINSNLYLAHPYTTVCLGELLLELSCAALSVAALFCIRYFFRRTYVKGNLLSALSAIAYGPRVLILVRLATAPFGIIPLMDSPFAFIFRGFMAISLLFMVMMFLWLLKHIPRQSSVMLRFFMLSVVFSVLPLILFMARHIIIRSLYTAELETYVTIPPLLLIPVALTCSFIQNKIVSFDQTAGKIMVFGCSFVTELFMALLLNSSTLNDASTLWHIIVVSPVLYLIMEPWIQNFLFPPVENLERILLDLEHDVYRASELPDICRNISVWLLQVLNSSFIYMYHIEPHSDVICLLYHTDTMESGEQHSLESILQLHMENSTKQREIIRHPGKGISVPLLRGSDLFGYIFIGNRLVTGQNRSPEPYSSAEVRMTHTVARIMMEALMMSDIKKKTIENLRIQDMTVMGMAAMVESRDNSTGGHIRRTSAAVRIFADKLLATPGFRKDHEWLNMVIRAAPMHDLGKVAVDDRILRKEGAFTEDEYREMKKHSEEGAKVVHIVLDQVEDNEFRTIAENVAHYHHEKWNGKGYPAGLKGDSIPLEARIMAFADVFDALVSKRCYKEAFSFEKAYDIISNDLGSHFDPELGKAFLSCFPELERLYKSEFTD